MKIKQQTPMETFNDGLVTIMWEQYGQAARRWENIRYQERVVGATRFFAAAHGDVKIRKALRIPVIPGIQAGMTGLAAEIQGERYDVRQIQVLSDTLPPTLQLTLE